MSSLRSQEIEFEEGQPQRKVKVVALKYMRKFEKTKVFQAKEVEDSEEEDELSLLSRRVNKLWKKRQGKFIGSRRTGVHS